MVGEARGLEAGVILGVSDSTIVIMGSEWDWDNWIGINKWDRMISFRLNLL